MWLSVDWFLPLFWDELLWWSTFFLCWWRVSLACDRWWLFSLLWLLCLGHMCIDLLCCFNGICVSWGLPKLIWSWGGASDSPWLQGEYCLLSLRNLVFWLLPSWVENLVFVILLPWFEGELVLWRVYCIFYFSIVFASYSPKSLGFTYYTSLYLLNYAYHCARTSSNEMWATLLDHAR
jgi:hypothetical protein